MYQIHRQDILDWAREYQGEPFHAMLTDAPYHLTSITKRFGKPGSAPAKGDVYRRASNGFMNSVWDSVDEKGMGIAFDPATWAALAQHLYPGAFIMAFGGSRGYHRMATAMEDAGLIIHPAMGWLTLSGFPKATRIKGYGSPAFKGHRYGLQALKPAFEFIAVAQVPYVGRPLDSIVATGAGALNIDQSRIGTAADMNPNDFDDRNRTAPKFNGLYNNGKEGQYRSRSGIVPNGRWPSNFLLQCGCDPRRADPAEHQENCPVRLFDEQAGESVSTIGHRDPNGSMGYHGGATGTPFRPDGYDDSGPASRMFHQSSWQYEVAEQLAGAEPVRYEPKVSSSERDAGLENLETITRHRTRPDADPEKLTGLNKEPRFAPTQVKNNHPTLKPISLTKYLATLLLPPAAYAPRRILIPFGGVGSEGAGAILAGWEEVVIVEKEAEYCRIMEPRLRWWSQWPGWGQTDVDTILAAAKVDEGGQMSLFDEG